MERVKEPTDTVHEQDSKDNLNADQGPQSVYNPMTFHTAHLFYRLGAASYSWWYGPPGTRAVSQVKEIPPNPFEWIESFSFRDGSWQKVTDYSKRPTDRLATVNIATYNVFTSSPVIDWIIASADRFKYQLEHLLPQLNADVLCLNEVSVPFLRLLLQQKWVQEQYVLTEISEEYFKRVARGVLVLSRVPLRMRPARQPIDRGANLVSLAVGPTANDEVLVCAAHLTAEEERFEIRNLQLQQMRAELDRFVFPRMPPVCLLGDLNLHKPLESGFITAPYYDVWSNLRPTEDGFTWDWKENTLTQKFLPSDGRRMRLDRICLRPRDAKSFETSPDLMPQSIEMFGNAPMYQPSQGTYSYLFPSDHFGLLCKFRVLGAGEQAASTQVDH